MSIVVVCLSFSTCVTNLNTYCFVFFISKSIGTLQSQVMIIILVQLITNNYYLFKLDLMGLFC